MIGAVVRVGWLALRRDPVALVLTLVLPLVFFTVFASVFRDAGAGGGRAVAAAVIDRDDSERSRRFAALLAEAPGLDVVADPADDADPVAAREVPLAIVLLSGFGERFPPSPGAEPGIALRVDTSHPLARDVGTAAVRAAAVRLGLQGLPGVAADADGWIDTVDVFGAPGKDPAVAYFAAGLGVMFLLFAVSGRAAILIEERETGVLERLLTSGLGLTRLLLGRFAFLAALGTFQVTLMFAWGAAVFGLDLGRPSRLVGFAVLTVATAAAAAGFGLVLASACRTRAQLNGVAAVSILILSAVGGSLFPRFLMPEAMQTVGLATFNAWALDGYRKLFWYGAAPADLAPQVAVLVVSCAAFLALARWLASRWERA